MRGGNIEEHQDRGCVPDVKYLSEQRRKFTEEEVPVFHYEQLCEDNCP